MDVWTKAVLLLGVVGTVFLFVGISGLRTPRRVGWLTVPGTVVAWSGRTTRFGGDLRAGGDAAYPVVDYPLPDGSTGRFTNRTTVDLGMRRTGQQVAVLVDPEDVHHAELASTTGQARLLGGVFVVFGVLVLGVGIAVAVVGFELGS